MLNPPQVVESLQPVLDYGAQVFLVAAVISVILPVFLVPGTFHRKMDF